jgi:hypothetical protein
LPLHPRNPQQQSSTGQAKDAAQRGNTMRISHYLRLLLFAFMMLAIPSASSAGIIFSIGIAPPPLPVYVQPICPGDGYIWTPGYWAYGDDGYFWVPGTWVLVPEPGFLWTPGYWGWGDGVFLWHEGYWGPHIGFYGGVNYGFGYVGVGYLGGHWDGGHFFYNQAVSNVNVTVVHNVYRTTVVNNVTVNNVSFNGPGGVTARPTPEEEAVANERHIAPTPAQTQHVQMASTNRQLYESVNHGKPAIAATAKPGEFKGKGVVAAKSAAPSYRPVAERKATTENAAKMARPNNNVPRPGNNVPPPEASTRNTPAERNVPRPPTAEKSAPRPENAPRSETASRAPAEHNVPRPPSAERNAPRPENEAQPKSASRPEAESRREGQPPAKSAAPRPEPKPEEKRPPAER